MATEEKKPWSPDWQGGMAALAQGLTAMGGAEVPYYTNYLDSQIKRRQMELEAEKAAWERTKYQDALTQQGIENEINIGSKLGLQSANQSDLNRMATEAKMASNISPRLSQPTMIGNKPYMPSQTIAPSMSPIVFDPNNRQFLDASGQPVTSVRKGQPIRSAAISPETYSARETAKGQAQYEGIKESTARATALRNELQAIPAVKEFETIKNQVGSMDALLTNIKTGDGESALALDQGLITLFNKITDPTSVVRESEYERTPANLSLINRFSGALEKLSKGGAGLTQKDRESLVFGAKVIANSRAKEYNRVVTNYEKLASKMEVDPEMVIGGYGKFDAFGNQKQNKQESPTSGTVGNVSWKVIS